MRMPARKLARLSVLALVCLLTAAPGGCTPKGEDMTPGLKGVDANANGIRDDIDALISEKYADTARMKITAEDYAIAVQAFMEAKTKQEAYDAARASGHVIDCIVHVVIAGNDSASYNKRGQLIDEIVAYTANTRERFEKYWQASKMLSGSTLPINTSPECR